MADKIVLYTSPMSRGRVARWMLEEVGVVYETHLLDYGTSMKAPEYLAINPMGKVPALTHNGAVITEVSAICAYLAEVFPQAGLKPLANDPAALAAYHRWMFFIAGPMEAAITNKILNVSVPDDKKGMTGYGSFELVFKTLEEAIKTRMTLAGDRFTAVDLLAASYLGFYLSFGVIPANPVFEAYVKAHKARPASIKAEGIDNALVAEQKKD